MTSKPFLDTNVLIYAFTTRRGQTNDKLPLISEDILMQGGIISVQVLTEFSDVMMRKHHKSWTEISRMLERISGLCQPVIPLTAEIHATAVQFAARYGFRIFDALLLAAATQAGCDLIYTEDLQHGQIIEGLRIINPFRE